MRWRGSILLLCIILSCYIVWKILLFKMLLIVLMKLIMGLLFWFMLFFFILFCLRLNLFIIRSLNICCKLMVSIKFLWFLGEGLVFILCLGIFICKLYFCLLFLKWMDVWWNLWVVLLNIYNEGINWWIVCCIDWFYVWFN